MKLEKLETKRHFIDGKIIIGIDPSKTKHQAMVIDEKGIPMGKSFYFQNNYHGFNQQLLTKLKILIPESGTEKVTFAVETSINFWQKLCFFLHHQGFNVLLVSPLTTKRERPRMNNNFSKTDPKDALVVANSARQGFFNFYKIFSDQSEAMHRLSITYDKLKNQLTLVKQRIRSQMEIIFPEFTDRINLDTVTARHLLSKYLSPQDFQNLSILSELRPVGKLSHNKYDFETLKNLKEATSNSIGIPLGQETYIAERLTLNCWLGQIRLIEEQIDVIMDQLILYAEKTQEYSILKSIKGISHISAARFIAEVKDLSQFSHYKQIEAFAGLNLRLADSANYSGYRRITHIGNARLRAILYKMAEETKNYIPEIRNRFIKRQMKHPKYTKNVVACTPNLLRLILTLVKQNKTYQINIEKQKELDLLEAKYQELKETWKTRKLKKAI